MKYLLVKPAEILCSIPLSEQEGQQALNTAYFSIHFVDHFHGTAVWGLVCVDSPTMSVRWRHRVSRSLERATEEFVCKLWDQAGPDNMFREFAPGHTIPVREPLSTTDAYVGEVLPPGPKLKELAKEGKSIELKIAKRVVLRAALASAHLRFPGLFSELEADASSILSPLWLPGRSR